MVLNNKKIFFYKNIKKNMLIYKLKKCIILNDKINDKKYKKLKWKKYKDSNSNKKINVKFCVFLGREKNMKILHIYIELLLKDNIINEYHMYDFSRNINDHLFIKNEYERLFNMFDNRIFLHNYENNEKIISIHRVKTNWNPFYKKIYETSSSNDIIIKCDDDILFIDIHALKNAINDRFNDKISFLIHSNCINNGVCAYYQKYIYPKLLDNLNKYPKGGILGILFEKPEIAYAIHNQFTNDLLLDMNNINKYIMNDVYINSRISINFILINGRDTKYFKNIEINDEYELSSYIPELLCRPNKIKGDLITSHLSYSIQEKIILMKDDIINLYSKLANNFKLSNYYKNILNNFNKNQLLKIPKPLYNSNHDLFTVKNWIKDNSYYIKNKETNLYMYINYEDESILLSKSNKTLFEINIVNDNIYEINLGIYYLNRYNIIGNFKNEIVLLKCIRDDREKYILKEDIDENGYFYLKFLKYSTYIALNSTNSLDINVNKKNKWIFEKAILNENNQYINVIRYDKNKKFYYKNVNNDETYTNFYQGWGLEYILE